MHDRAPGLFPCPPTTLKMAFEQVLTAIPAIIALAEKEAAICFRFIRGRTDYAGFSGKDPMFLNWVKDLFLYY